MARRTSSITIFAAILAALLALWAPAALAHHKDDHARGGGKPASESPSSDGSDHDGDAGNEDHAYTEDDDDDGADDRDNTGQSSQTSGEDQYPNESQHPSGKDRYEENGGSGNQGKSESNPDDSKGPMRYEGAQGDDKPNGPGGSDVYDQDGNNGCGNDQDFDDDNNGWCGKPPKVKSVNKPVCDADVNMAGIQKCEEVKGEVIVTTPTMPCDADATMPGIQKCEKPDDVLDGVIAQPAVPEIVEIPTPAVDAVLGVRVSAAAQPAAVAPAAVAAAPATQGAVLPFTGTTDLIPVVGVALMLIAAGALTIRGRFSSK